MNKSIVLGGGLLRDIDEGRPFEVALRDLFGAKVKESEYFAETLWGALSNITWQHHQYGSVAYSFRAAGDVVAALRGEGDYCDWYCSAPDGVVSDEMASAMARRGWIWVRA